MTINEHIIKTNTLEKLISITVIKTLIKKKTT